MKCPYCGNHHSTTTKARPSEDGCGNRRYRKCLRCNRNFQTIEVVDRHRLDISPEQLEALPVLTLPAQQDVAPPKRKRQSRRIGEIDANQVYALCGAMRAWPDLTEGVVTWWNESRRSKHGSRAVWSTRALKASLDRLVQLQYKDAAALVAGGIEHGWMALKLEYLGKQHTAQEEGVMPKDPAMRAALESFN